MKKILTLFFAFVLTLSANAVCVTKIFKAYDEGEYYGKIILGSNCRFSLSTVDGERFDGTYEIVADELIAGRQYSLYFYLSDGRKISATYAWGIQDGQSILLDGFVFREN